MEKESKKDITWRTEVVRTRLSKQEDLIFRAKTQKDNTNRSVFLREKVLEYIQDIETEVCKEDDK